jgi:hypothetical protein
LAAIAKCEMCLNLVTQSNATIEQRTQRAWFELESSMNYWIYKCNRKASYAQETGDWRRVFEEPWHDFRWGTVDRLRGLSQIRRGDKLICTQSDISGVLLVGLALAKGVEDGELVVRATERIGARIRPLKDADQHIAQIPALRSGPVATAFAISLEDAGRLLAAARASVRDQAVSTRKPAKWTRANNLSLKSVQRRLKELPASERQIALREVRLVIRNAELRNAILQYWPRSCAACQRQLEIDGRSECEVAHVRDVQFDGADQLRNAVPLCRTHHWAFDQHLWGIRPKRLDVVVRKSYHRNPVLSEIHGSRIKRPSAPQLEFLADELLEWRWRKFKKVAGRDI